MLSRTLLTLQSNRHQLDNNNEILETTPTTHFLKARIYQIPRRSYGRPRNSGYSSLV